MALHYRTFFVVPLIAAALTLTGCAAGPSSAAGASTTSRAKPPGTLQVVATTDVWGDVAAAVGGDHVTVTSLIDSPDKDPHEYQATGQNQLAVSKASVVLENGGGYDSFIDSMLASAKNDSRVTLNAVDISGKKRSGAADFNEHVWYDLPTAGKVANKLRAAYSRADPKHAEAYEKNAAAFTTKLDALEAQAASLKSKYHGEGASVTEPVPLYLLDAIGLVDKTPEKFSEAVENDSDVAPSVLAKTLALYSDHTVKLLAYNEQTTGAQTEAVLKTAKHAGVPVVPVTETLPPGKTYLSWMAANLDAVSAALGK